MDKAQGPFRPHPDIGVLAVAQCGQCLNSTGLGCGGGQRPGFFKPLKVLDLFACQVQYRMDLAVAVLKHGAMQGIKRKQRNGNQAGAGARGDDKEAVGYFHRAHKWWCH